MSSAQPDRDVVAVLEERAIAFEKSAKTLRDAIAVMRGGAAVAGRLYAPRTMKRAGRQVGTMPAAVVDFFIAHPTGSFIAQEVLAGIKASGWEPIDGKDPLNQLRNVLARLTQLGEIQRVEKGAYAAISTEPTLSLVGEAPID